MFTLRHLALLAGLAVSGCKEAPQVGRLVHSDPAPLASPSASFTLQVEQRPVGRMGFGTCWNDTSQAKVNMETGEVTYPFSSAGGTAKICLTMFGDLAHELDRHTFTVTAKPDASRSPETVAAVVDPFVETLAELAKKARSAKVPTTCPEADGEVEFVDLGFIDRLSTGGPAPNRATAFVRSPTYGVLERPLDPQYFSDVQYVATKVPWVGLIDVKEAAAPTVIKGQADSWTLTGDLYVAGRLTGVVYLADVRSKRVVCRTSLDFTSSKKLTWFEEVRRGEHAKGELSTQAAQVKLDQDFGERARDELTAAAARLHPKLVPGFRRRYRL